MLQGAFRLFVRPQLLAELARTEGEVVALAPQLRGGSPGHRETQAPAIDELGAELARATERIAMLTGSLAAPRDAEPVLNSLPRLASQEGVHFRRFAPEPEYRLDDYRGRAASVVAEGSFFELLGLFERISRLPQLVLIEDLELQAAPDGLVQCRFVAVSVRVADTGTRPAAAAGRPREASPSAGSGLGGLE